VINNIKEERRWSGNNLVEGHKTSHKDMSYNYILFFNKILNGTQQKESISQRGF
jgi:hypothetical protein